MSRRLPWLAVSLAILVTGGSLMAQKEVQEAVHVSTETPADPDGSFLFPGEIIQHRFSYSSMLTVPGAPAIDALHRMDKPNNWLFSVEAPSEIGGALAFRARPQDVIRIDVSTFSVFFDGSCVGPAVPDGSSLDAIYLEGGDGGDLVVSFDVPTRLGTERFEPSQLARFEPSGGTSCDWTLAGMEFDFRFGIYDPASANVTGVDRMAGEWIVVLDVPTDLGPPAQHIGSPGQIVATDGQTWRLYRDLQQAGTPGWPINSLVDGLSFEANPGRIASLSGQIRLSKAASQITITCPAGCSSGGTYFGVYEGTIATLRSGAYDHVQKSCTQNCPGEIAFVPAVESGYYLVVPHNGKEEGSYGLDSGRSDRPQPLNPQDRCVEYQVLTPCP